MMVNIYRICFIVVLLFSLCVYSCERNDVSSRKSNIVIISVDTLRADQLGSYGYPRPTSQCIDRLSKHAVLFSNVRAESPWTVPSHLSLFTGLYPGWHGGIDDRKKLKKSVPTLAQVLQENGYITAAFTDGGYMVPEYGFDRGFEVFNSEGQGQQKIHERAFSWLRNLHQTPFFLFLHYYDVHYPYNQPNPQGFRYFSRDTGQLPKKGRVQALAKPGEPENTHANLTPQSKLMVKYRNLYDDGIFSTDNGLGDLLVLLKRLKLYDSSLIILLSDHGEEFAEHGTQFHSTTLYRELLEVPVIMKLPNDEKSGAVIDHMIQLSDIMPTLLSFLKLDPLPGLHGYDFSFVFNDSKPPVRFRDTFYSMTHYVGMKRALQKGAFKLIHSLKNREIEMYNVRDDPGEQVPLKDIPHQKRLNLETRMIELLETLVPGIHLWLNPGDGNHRLEFEITFKRPVADVLPFFLESEDHYELSDNKKTVAGSFSEASHVDGIAFQIPDLHENDDFSLELTLDGQYYDPNSPTFGTSLTSAGAQGSTPLILFVHQIQSNMNEIPRIVPGVGDKPAIHLFRPAIPFDDLEILIPDENLVRELKTLGYMQ